MTTRRKKNDHRQRHVRPDYCRALAVFLGLVLSACPREYPARAATDARALAMGGAQTAASRGVSAAAWNPANLAFSPGVSVSLAGASLDVHNNSFNLERYNQFSGQTLTNADKQRLLADIPENGFRLDAQAAAGALGLQIGRFALTTGAAGAGRGKLDRDVFDLILFGNEPGKTVDFSDTWGDCHAVARASLCWGQTVLTGPYGRVAVGISASYLKGLYELRVEEASGFLTTRATEIAGEAYLAAVTAESGSGFALDVGAAWQTARGWTLGLAIDNLVSRLSWQGNVQRTEYRVTAQGINLLNEDLGSGIVESDTTYAVGGYTSSLPCRMRLGAARDTGRLVLAADYEQGLAERAGTSTVPRLNIGAEWRPLGWLAPRAGLSFGGSVGLGVAGGLGLRAAFWQVDLAVLHRGGFSGTKTRGLGLGLSTQLVF